MRPVAHWQRRGGFTGNVTKLVPPSRDSESESSELVVGLDSSRSASASGVGPPEPRNEAKLQSARVTLGDYAASVDRTKVRTRHENNDGI